MYINQRNDLIELINTIEQMLTYIRSNNINSQLPKQLNDCVEGMQYVKSFLIQQNINVEIMNLDQVIEVLQLLYTNYNFTDYKQTIKKIIKQIGKIKNELYYSSQFRYRVLFLPYKASMWTSLESIWIAALEDPNCEPIVVPIPYYELDKHGNRIKMCYEGDLYPDYVPVSSYLNYDISAVQPEIIYIHNPYDDDNRLTRIDEKYFSINLKNYTQCLVYSPYFTFGNYGKNSKGIQYQTKATYIVDKIVVQSKRVAGIFETYNHPKDQFIIEGSPKIDAIVKTINRPVEIPEEWKPKLEGKNIFLLNTHLSYFPQGSILKEKFGNYAEERHREIMDAFKNHPECGLIWRPHPLLRNMIEKSFPECLPFLNELDEYFYESDNCIIDRTADYSIAFRLSKAMISTYSTLVNEYMITGKPVLIFQTCPKAEDAKIAPINYLYNYYRFKPDNLTFEKFMENVNQGLDPKKEERMSMINKAFINLDGTAGEKIHIATVSHILKNKNIS